MITSTVGIHYVLELYGCPSEILDDELYIRNAIAMAADKACSTLLEMSSHKFSPQGVTALGLLAESHLSIHTWPEAGYAAADIFTCGRSSDPDQACQFLIQHLHADSHSVAVVHRGQALHHKVLPIHYHKGKKTCRIQNARPPFG